MIMTDMTEAELAEHYDRTRDISDFDDEHPIPLTRRRLDISISVRFSSEEIEALRARAEAAGMKVTQFIRAVVLQHQGAEPIDISALRRLAAAVARDVNELQRKLA
jgi:predicted DNA binding CopG/RHH family protein